jgi:hypothetical protein
MTRDALLAVLLCAACPDFDRGLELCMENGGCGSTTDGSMEVPDGSVEAAPRWRVDVASAGLNDLPVLVTLQPQHVADVRDPQHDLRFVGPAGEDLPFEVEQFDAGGPSSVWLRVPALDGGAVLLFSGPAAHGAADAAAVWSGYELVHHFGPGLLSSVDARYAASRTGGAPGPGVIGDATWFAGMGSALVTFADGGELLNGWDQFTLAFWLYADYPTPSAVPGSPEFLDKGGSLDHGVLASGGTRFQINLHFAGSNANLGGPLPLRQWIDVVYTFDGTRLDVYVDGQPVSSQPMMNGPLSLMGGTNPFYLGHLNSQLTGAIDELRIEKRSHDAAWVAAQHLSMSRQMVNVSAQ